MSAISLVALCFIVAFFAGTLLLVISVLLVRVIVAYAKWRRRRFLKTLQATLNQVFGHEKDDPYYNDIVEQLGRWLDE